MANWHYGDGAGGPHPTKNDWTGYFSNSLQQIRFDSRTTTISDDEFKVDINLTRISLPQATTIGAGAFGEARLVEINIPKATIIGDRAFFYIVNEDTTVVTMNRKFDSASEKDRIFGSRHWTHFAFKWTDDSGTPATPVAVAWHYGDGAGGPHATKNDWKGAFSSHAKQVEFEAIKNSISAHGFDNEGSITAISLPNATTIGEYAFFGSNFTDINLPKVYSIGNNAFTRTSNYQTTEVSLPDLFDTNADKNRIFGDNQWQRITFHWLHDTLPANSIWWNGKFQDTQFEMDGKTVVKFIWNGKECVLKSSGGGGITGNFGDFEDYNVQLPSGTPTIYWSGSFLFNKKIILCGTPGSGAYWMVGDVPGDGTITNIRKLTVPFTSSNFKSISIHNGKAYFIESRGNFKIADVDDDLNFTNVKDLSLVLPSVSNSSWESMAFVGNKAVISNVNEAVLAVGDVAADGSLSNFVKKDQNSWNNQSGFKQVKITGNKLLVVSNNAGHWWTADIDDNGNITNQKFIEMSSKLKNGGNGYVSVEPLGNGKVLAINALTSRWMIGDGS